MDQQAEMKRRVAGTVKWNAIDKLLSMALYTVTGIVLAREVPKDDFGLLGAVMVFAAFAALFVDSGFSSALIQKKRVSRLDYSSVFWLNIAVATAIYIILYFCAPLIARIFQNDLRIIPVARVALLAFVINATAIVQTNRLMKRMQVKMITVSNALGLIISSVAAIWMAVEGMGVWALVWQTLMLSAVKSIILWTTGHWTPLFRISLRSLKGFFKVGSGMMGGAFLNILFKNIYAFIIGMRAGVLPLSYYTQADKWSNMGISSLTAIFTQSFLPALSQFQDDPRRFAASTAKMNRFTSYLLFLLRTGHNSDHRTVSSMLRLQMGCGHISVSTSDAARHIHRIEQPLQQLHTGTRPFAADSRHRIAARLGRTHRHSAHMAVHRPRNGRRSHTRHSYSALGTDRSLRRLHGESLSSWPQDSPDATHGSLQATRCLMPPQH